MQKQYALKSRPGDKIPNSHWVSMMGHKVGFQFSDHLDGLSRFFLAQLREDAPFPAGTLWSLGTELG